MARSSIIQKRPSRRSAGTSEYSAHLEKVAWFTLRRKGFVASVWVVVAIAGIAAAPTIVAAIWTT